MDDQKSLIPWWRQERAQIRAKLIQKQKTTGLTEVEEMTLNPITLQQARNQVKMLNGSVNPQDSDTDMAEV